MTMSYIEYITEQNFYSSETEEVNRSDRRKTKSTGIKTREQSGWKKHRKKTKQQQLIRICTTTE